MKKTLGLLLVLLAGTMISPNNGEVYVESGGAYVSTRDGKPFTRPDQATPALIDQQTGKQKSPVVDTDTENKGDTEAEDE